jgi:hypothetical protein
VSELVTDLDWWAATRYPHADEEWGPASGRHVYNEDAALTPIFDALTRGGWRSRQHEPAAPSYTPDHTPDHTADHTAGHAADPLDEFHRDPLTAPIPVQAPASARSRRELRETGRHRRLR